MSLRFALLAALLALGGCSCDETQPVDARLEASRARGTRPIDAADAARSRSIPSRPVPPAREGGPGFEAPVPALADDAPARRYAAMSAHQCQAAVGKRDLPVTPTARRYPGVVAPVRWTGPVNGVLIDAPGPKTPLGVLDCRLALAVGEMATVLRRFDVTALKVDSMYRKDARIAGKRQRSQHATGLAIDILAMTIRGTQVEVESAWSGQLGTPPCGPNSTLQHDANEQAVVMRSAVCEIGRRGLFHHMLTPNRNQAHADHLHFDLEAGEQSLLLE